MRQALFWRHKNPLNFEQMPDETLEMHEFEKEIIDHFVHEYLESDGLFILRVLSSNTSDFVCTELIQELWKYYRKQRKFNRSSGDEDEEEDDLNEDEEEFRKRPANVPKSAPKAASPTQIRNTYSERKAIESNIEEEDEENDDEDEEDEEEKEEVYTNLNNNNNKSKTPTMSRNSKSRPPSDLKMNDPRMRANPAVNMRQKTRINKNLSRPFASIGGQLASMYSKSKKSSQNSSDETSTVSSSKFKMSRTISHDPKTLTSANTYLLHNSQLLPQNDKVFVATSKTHSNNSKVKVKNRPNVISTSNDESKRTEDLIQTDEDELEQRQQQQPQQQSELKAIDDNGDKPKNIFFRLNSNNSNEEKEKKNSRYLETET